MLTPARLWRAWLECCRASGDRPGGRRLNREKTLIPGAVGRGCTSSIGIFRWAGGSLFPGRSTAEQRGRASCSGAGKYDVNQSGGRRSTTPATHGWWEKLRAATRVLTTRLQVWFGVLESTLHVPFPFLRRIHALPGLGVRACPS